MTTKAKLLVGLAAVVVAGGTLVAASHEVPGIRSSAAVASGLVPSLCVGADRRVVVDLAAHRLALCDGTTLVQAFSVRLGRGGVGKTREGDGKTPIGLYALGSPRPSQRYGTFIPIGYPTDEQRKLGYTGSAVGVHGPARWIKWLGAWVNTFDSSDGCVGVALDGEIETIGAWVRAVPGALIELR
jgi:hypothetical protein